MLSKLQAHAHRRYCVCCVHYKLGVGVEGISCVLSEDTKHRPISSLHPQKYYRQIKACY